MVSVSTGFGKPVISIDDVYGTLLPTVASCVCILFGVIDTHTHSGFIWNVTNGTLSARALLPLASAITSLVEAI
jgi:hypothetical protein